MSTVRSLVYGSRRAEPRDTGVWEELHAAVRRREPVRDHADRGIGREGQVDERVGETCHSPQLDGDNVVCNPTAVGEPGKVPPTTPSGLGLDDTGIATLRRSRTCDLLSSPPPGAVVTELQTSLRGACLSGSPRGSPSLRRGRARAWMEHRTRRGRGHPCRWRPSTKGDPAVDSAAHRS